MENYRCQLHNYGFNITTDVDSFHALTPHADYLHFGYTRHLPEGATYHYTDSNFSYHIPDDRGPRRILIPDFFRPEDVYDYRYRKTPNDSWIRPEQPKRTESIPSEYVKHVYTKFYEHANKEFVAHTGFPLVGDRVYSPNLKCHLSVQAIPSICFGASVLPRFDAREYARDIKPKLRPRFVVKSPFQQHKRVPSRPKLTVDVPNYRYGLLRLFSTRSIYRAERRARRAADPRLVRTLIKRLPIVEPEQNRTCITRREYICSDATGILFFRNQLCMKMWNLVRRCCHSGASIHRLISEEWRIWRSVLVLSLIHI